MKLFVRWLKSSRKLVKHATDLARAENKQSGWRVRWKIRGKCWEGIYIVPLRKWLQKQESVKLQCVASSKKTSESILTKCRQGMNFLPLMNVWDLTDPPPLNMYKSTGPDLLHPRVLQTLEDMLCGPLNHIFNKPAETGIIPGDWKSANITAIHKKGNRQGPGARFSKSRNVKKWSSAYETESISTAHEFVVC